MSPHEVRIEPVGPQHIAAIQTLAADPAIAEFTNVPHPYPADGAQHYVAMAEQQRQAGDAWNFAVLLDETFVGVCGLIRRDPPGTFEIGYWIGKPFWGRGLASAAVHHLLRYAFETMQAEQLIGRCLIRNIASRRVIEKSGFQFLGLRPNDLPKWDDEQLYVFTLDRRDWERQTAPE